MSRPIAIRFVGILSSESAEAAARDAMVSLGLAYPDVASWDVCLRPPITLEGEGGYAVHVQAKLEGGGVVAIRSQADDLLDGVRDAFDGMEGLLQQEFRVGSPATGWLAPSGMRLPGLPA